MNQLVPAAVARRAAMNAAAAQGACPTPVPYNTGMTGAPNFMKWSPSLGDCPTDLSRLLCWLFKGYCSFNRFGKIGTSRLVTNTITLPDPAGIGGFNIGPEGAAQSLGVFFPRDWVGEACMRGMYRFKVSFQVTITENVSEFTQGDLVRAAFDNLDLRVVQVGTEDNIHTAMSIGDAQDAERSTDIPSQGGFWLACGDEFIPFGVAPELQAFDYRGLMPGVVGDEYNLTSTIQTFWKAVC